MPTGVESSPEYPPFITAVELVSERIDDATRFPFSLPAAKIDGLLTFDPNVTFVVGENGSGKSTLVEAIAIAAGFNPEGGTKNFKFHTRPSESTLHKAMRLRRSYRRERTGFFLRAESMFNLATEIEALDREPATGPPIIDSYGDQSLHEMSHGESFLAVIKNRFGREGLYILDEPESALSPQTQLGFLALLDESVRDGSQHIIATHSPIIMAYPQATIYLLNQQGIARVDYEETEHYQITRQFLNHRESFLRHLLGAE